MIERLVGTIMTNLNNLNGFAGMNQAERTMAVKTVLVEACNNIDVDDDVAATFASPEDELNVNGAEWLYDVTALLYDIPVDFSRTVLVAECEWGNQLEIMNDFQKLLLARADVRVMVFDGTWPPGYQRVFEIFQNNIANYKQAQLGDIWLFATWTVDEEWKFRRIDAKPFLDVQDQDIE